MNALLSFSPLYAKQKGRFIRAILLSLLTLAAGIALLGVSGWFLTAAALSTAGVAFNLFAPSAGVRGIAFVRILSRYGEKLEGHDATLRLLSDIRGWLFVHLFAAIPLPAGGLDRPDLVNRLVADVDALDNAFLTALGPITTALGVGLAMSLGLATLLPSAAIGYGLCFLGVALLVPAALVIASRRAGTAMVAASAGLRQTTLEGLDAHRDLVLFGQISRALDSAAAAARKVASVRRRLGYFGAAASAATQILAGTAMLFVLVAGIAALRLGHIGGPILVGILFAAVASFEAAAPLVRGATRLTSAAAAADRLRAMGELKSPIGEAAHCRPIVAGGKLSLDHVRFGYDPRRPVLNDLSLSVATGEHIAIIGTSGAGKSTIAQLLGRLADPQSGSIELNDVDLRDLSLADVRRTVALMTQDAPIFNDTLRNNLRIGRPDADDAALWQALDAVLLKDFVLALPQRLNTVVGEIGATLSSGQARRLALARTLLSPAPILILDEPTSGLDRETEIAFFRNFVQACRGRTVVLITHGALPEGLVDRIYRLEDGSLLPSPRQMREA